MRIASIFICIFSLASSSLFSQNQKKIIKEDSTKWKYKPNMIVGFDALNLGASIFRDRKLTQGFVSSQISKKVHAVIDIGYDKNIYNINNYDAKASGIFAKIGGFYMLSMDKENDMNGFYAGAKLAGSFYNQEYRAIPVKGLNSEGTSISFSPTSQSSYWIEAALGARVQVFKSPFFIEVNIQPRYLAYTTKQEEIRPMIIPGFGKSSSNFTMGVSWNIAYKF